MYAPNENLEPKGPQQLHMISIGRMLHGMGSSSLREGQLKKKRIPWIIWIIIIVLWIAIGMILGIDIPSRWGI